MLGNFIQALILDTWNTWLSFIRPCLVTIETQTSFTEALEGLISTPFALILRLYRFGDSFGPVSDGGVVLQVRCIVLKQKN